jgi:hypothetical protein
MYTFPCIRERDCISVSTTGFAPFTTRPLEGRVEREGIEGAFLVLQEEKNQEGEGYEQQHVS